MRLDDPIGRGRRRWPAVAGRRRDRARAAGPPGAASSATARTPTTGSCEHAVPRRARLLASPCPTAGVVLARNEHFKYSNIGYSLLGLVVEAVTGTAVRRVRRRRRVLEPLGPDPTPGRSSDPARADEYAAGHTGLLPGEQTPAADPRTSTPGRWPRPPGSSPPPRTSAAFAAAAHVLGDPRLLDRRRQAADAAAESVVTATARRSAATGWAWS